MLVCSHPLHFTISTQGHEARPAPKASVRWSRVVCVSEMYKMYLGESMQMPSFSDVFHQTSVIFIVLIVLVGVSSCAAGGYKHQSKHVLICLDMKRTNGQWLYDHVLIGGFGGLADVCSPDLGGLPQSSATSGSSQSTSNCLSVECCDACTKLFASWRFS